MRFALVLAAALAASGAAAQIVDDPDRIPEIAKPTESSDFPWRPSISICRQSTNLAAVQFCIDEETRGHVFAVAEWDNLDAAGRAAAVKCAEAPRLFYARLARCMRLQFELADQRQFLREQREWSSRRQR